MSNHFSGGVPNSATSGRLLADETTYDPTGICSSGYKGILCSECQRGYQRFGKYDC